MLVDFAIAAERDRQMAPVAAIREACLFALPSDSDDDGGRTPCGAPLAIGTGTGSRTSSALGYAMVGGLALTTADALQRRRSSICIWIDCNRGSGWEPTSGKDTRQRR